MVLSDEKQVNPEMREFLYRDRTHLSAYCLAQVGLAFEQQEGQREKLAMVLKNIERPMIETVLGHAKGNLTHAASMLGINRATLRTKMQQLRIKG